jgi:uncharacterized membrane protein YeiB
MLYTKTKFLSFLTPDILVALTALGLIARALLPTTDAATLAFYGISTIFVLLITNLMKRLDLRWVLNLKFLTFTVIFCGVFATVLYTNPAHAQFLIQTQNALCAAFTGVTTTGGTTLNTNAANGVKDIIKIAIGFVRGVVILVVLGFAVAIGMNRDDKDKVRELVSTPMFLLAATIVVDIFSGVLSAVAGAGTAC